jgi:type II secretory pathway pseudopilin PulG
MKQTRHRTGFTLIELLVVMGILMFLFGLGIAILPAVYQRWETTKGAEIVQGALARARQEARRSGKPTGVRLLVGGQYAADLRLIQQPVMGSGAGGYFIPEGAGLPAKTIPAAPDPRANLTWYRMADPQPIVGERDIALPANVGIDMARCSVDGKTPTPNPPTDIVFSPGGGLSSASWGTDKLILYIRDFSLADPAKGSPTLIVIYVRTGLIAAHPVDTSGLPDPNNNNQPNVYFFCNDPRSSGL